MDITITDIRKYSNINNQRPFFLDTNVLYWYFYSRFDPKDTNKAKPYYDFVDVLVADGNPLYTSVFNVSELLHIIENNEYKIYKVTNPDSYYTQKDFRKDSSERKIVSAYIQTAFNSVSSTCQILEYDFKKTYMDEYVKDFFNHRFDPFDYAFLKNCIDKKHLDIVTDDGDFDSINIKGLHIYTANPKMLPSS